MKTNKILFSFCTALFLTVSGGFINSASAQQVVNAPTVINSGLKFCESTLPYRDGVLVANFGSQELEPLNNQGLGYISFITSTGEVEPFIAADGKLSAPKGMSVYKDYLLVADVNRVVVYNLPRRTYLHTVYFPSDDQFVNDIVIMGNMAIVSITNTGRIYGLELSQINDKESFLDVKPILLGEVTGANGLLLSDTTLFVASYNPTGTPDVDNVIYAVDLGGDDFNIRKLIPGLPSGQYDGLALSVDGSQLYFTSWTGGSQYTHAQGGLAGSDSISTFGEGALYRYNLPSKAKIVSRVTSIDLGVSLTAPADICITKEDMLYIPDLSKSAVYVVEL